ncbi:MAG: hypothetical protein AAGK21_00755 [Bacteroidota bacterium]
MIRVAAVAAMVAFAGCTSSTSLRDVDVFDLRLSEEALLGTWELVYLTSSGQMGPPETRRAREGQETLVFSENGMVTVTIGDQIIETETYQVVQTEYASELVMGGRGVIAGISGGRLYLDDRPVDGSLQEYHRR